MRSTAEATARASMRVNRKPNTSPVMASRATMPSASAHASEAVWGAADSMCAPEGDSPRHPVKSRHARLGR